MIKYDKLWETMQARGITQYDLYTRYRMNRSQLNRLRHDRNVEVNTIVNLDQIRNIKGYDIYMMSGEILPLSQKQAVSFKECLGRFLAEKNGSSF